MVEINGFDITLARGDSLFLRIDLAGRDLPEGTDAVFSLKKNVRSDEVLLQKRFDASDEKVSIVLYPAETNLEPGLYYWDLRLQIPQETGGYEVVTPMDYAAFYVADVVGTEIGANGDPGANPDLPVLQEALNRAELVIAAANEAASRAERAADAHAPKIGENGNWMLWNSEAGAYVDSGVLSVGTAEELVHVDAEKLGGKAPEYYLQPRNLLDNSDFRVAQAGYGAYHGNSKYACDRWLDTYGFGVFGYEEGYGLYVAKGDNHAYLEQRLEYPERLTGKSCTLAMKLSDGNVYTCNGVMVGNNELVARFSGANWELDLRGDRVQFVVTDGYVYVQWMALYAGTYTAETLPPYVPKGYAAELAECQRYAYITGSGNWLTGLRVGGHGLVVPLEIPVSMRSRPTVDGVFQAYVSGTEWDSIELATVGYDASTGYVHNIVFTVPDTLAVHDCCIVSGIVGLFADL